MTRPLIAVFVVLFASGVISAQDAIEPGMWAALLRTPGGEISFALKLEQQQGNWSCLLLNEGPLQDPSSATEVIEIPAVRIEGGLITLEFPHYDSRISALLLREKGKSSELRGTWRKRRGADKWDELPFRAVRVVRNPGNPATASADDRSPWPQGRWSVKFSSADDSAIGEFRCASDGRLTGTFQTTTGDYRYLCGDVSSGKVGSSGRRLRLCTFDGAHAFLFTAEEQENGSLKGDFWSGGQWHEEWTAVPDADAVLPDAFTLTQALDDVDLNDLQFPDTEGNSWALGDSRFAGKARVIELFGSWCPNCHDAAALLTELHSKYRDDGLSVVGVAFEVTGDFERDARQVQRYLERHDAEYPCLIGGLSDKSRATEQFRLLDRVRSYPTTIFLHADGSVRAIHTGFSGPATGEEYVRLRREFESIIQELLAE